MSENELISLEYLYKVQLLWRVTEKSFIEQTYHDNKKKILTLVTITMVTVSLQQSQLNQSSEYVIFIRV